MKNWNRYFTGNPQNEQDLGHLKSNLNEAVPHSSWHLEIYHKNSYAVWLEIMELPVRDYSGKILKVAGVAINISRSKRLEEDLRSSEEHFRDISESSPVGIFQIDGNDLYTYVNSRWQIITGQSLIATLGYNLWNILHQRDHEDIFNQWADCKKNNTEFIWECQIVRPDGEIRWVQIRTRFFYNDFGKNVLGTLEDITERKKAEERIQQFSRELERSNQDLNGFAAIASHDLQEPLRKIASFGTLLKKKYHTQL